jgi:small subunit ribosomal protein S1
VTKVVTFGAFVEILPGVEGLVHISELAQHHVENPREVVSQGQAVDVKIIEIDGERRRLSLSLKRVEPDDPVQPRADGGESVHLHPTIDLSGGDGGDEAELDEVPADETAAIALDEAPEGAAAETGAAAVGEAPEAEPAVEAEPVTAEAEAAPEAAVEAEPAAETADETAAPAAEAAATVEE